MIKRTLYFGNPAYLKTTNEQMVIEMQKSGETKTVPKEDIGIVILDHQQITIKQSLLAKLLGIILLKSLAIIRTTHGQHTCQVLKTWQV